MKATYFSVHLWPSKFSCADVLDKNAYPEMWKFRKNYESDIIPCPIFIFQNMSEGIMSMLLVCDILNVTLTEVQI